MINPSVQDSSRYGRATKKNSTGKLTQAARQTRTYCSVSNGLMGCVPLALPVRRICRKHWQSQWHTSIHD